MAHRAQALADRKRKWLAERQRCDAELEEARRSSQQEVESLKAQLRRARSSTDQAAAEQVGHAVTHPGCDCLSR